MGARASDVAAGALVVGLLAAAAQGSVASAAATTRAGRSAVAGLRALTDWDRDGSSPWLGEGDCAPFDAAVHRQAIDVPDNGVDEDCSGHDAVASGAGSALARAGAAGDVFYGELPEEVIEPYNVIWIVIDAVRADSASVLGYDRPTTPYLEDLATEALVFTNAWSQAPSTMLSFPSMLAGRIPGRMSWVEQAERLNASEEEMMVAERLAELGYRSQIIVHSYFTRHFRGLFQGYDVVSNLWRDGRMKPWYERSSPIATTQAIRFMEEDPAVPESDTPFFITAYFEDPHHPYSEHDEGYPSFRTRSARAPAIGEDWLEDKARYDREVAFADRHVGFLMEYLKHTPPLWDRTILVVLSDHGEEFGEHGRGKHARTCYRESTHVPLLIRIPGVEPRRIDTPVALVDVLPTLVEALGLDAGPEELDGQSLLIPALAPERVRPGRPISCTAVGGKPAIPDFAMRSVRVGDRALVHHVLRDEVELFDTSADRLEQEDLAAQPREAETVRQLRGALEATLEGNIIEDRLTR